MRFSELRSSSQDDLADKIECPVSSFRRPCFRGVETIKFRQTRFQVPVSKGAPPRAGRANSRFQLPETATRKRRRGQIPTSNFREASPPRVTKKQIIDSRFQFPVSVAIRWWGARNWRSKTQVKTEFPERDNERVKFELPELQFPTGMWECP